MSSAIKLDSEPIFLRIISFGAAAVHIHILSYRSTSDKTTNKQSKSTLSLKQHHHFLTASERELNIILT